MMHWPVEDDRTGKGAGDREVKAGKCRQTWKERDGSSKGKRVTEKSGGNGEVEVPGPEGRIVGGGGAGREGCVVTEETERTGGGEDLVGTGATMEDHRVVVWRKEIWRLTAVQASTPRRQ